MAKIKLSDMELDALKETANVGAGNASIALSDLTKKTVDLVVSDVKVAESNDLEKLFTGPQKLVIGIYTPIKKGITGNVLMMLGKKDALKLARQIQKKQYVASEDYLTPKDEKGLKKTGDTISDHYINSLNQFLGMNIEREDSNIVATFGESVVDIAMLSVHANTPQVLTITTEFSIKEKKIQGEFVLLLALRSVDALLNKLRKNFM